MKVKKYWEDTVLDSEFSDGQRKHTTVEVECYGGKLVSWKKNSTYQSVGDKKSVRHQLKSSN